MKTLILHGIDGSDFPHWQSHLASDLAKDYGHVNFPLLIDKNRPIKSVWTRQVKSILDDFKPEVVVCHSLANILWFHLCCEYELAKVKKLFLVAPPSLDTELERAESFFPVSIPTNLYAEKKLLITSNDDIYLDQDEADRIAKCLDIKHIVLNKAGHINPQSGFGQWDGILELIRGKN